MRPGHFERRLVLFRIEFRVVAGRQDAEYILGNHLDDLWVEGLDYGALCGSDVVDELVQSRTLDLNSQS